MNYILIKVLKRKKLSSAEYLCIPLCHLSVLIIKAKHTLFVYSVCECHHLYATSQLYTHLLLLVSRKPSDNTHQQLKQQFLSPDLDITFWKSIIKEHKFRGLYPRQSFSNLGKTQAIYMFNNNNKNQ